MQQDQFGMGGQGGYQQNNQSSGYSANPGYPNYSDYSQAQGYTTGFKKFNGLELVVILILISLIIGVGTWGFVASNARLRDQQRSAHIQQVINALDQFYTNSSLEPSKRKYPVSVCSNSLNEVDYESTLRLHLTGKQVQLDPHAYINSDNFPRDPWGTYQTQFGNKKVPFRCPNILPSGSAATSYDDQYPSCDFSPTRNYRKCYLFTSSNNGDSFQIGYWSEVGKVFVVYSRFRSDAVSVNYVSL